MLSSAYGIPCFSVQKTCAKFRRGYLYGAVEYRWVYKFRNFRPMWLYVENDKMTWL